MKQICKFAVVLMVLGVSAAWADGPKDADTPAKQAVTASAAAPEQYIIGTDDVLAINVWKEPEISRSVPVRPDGKISLPLIGDIEARGRTPKQLQDELQKKFTAYIAAPDVTVIVEQVKSQKINILGEVKNPGSYSLAPPMRVLDAIALSGGFKDFAKTKDIYVLRAQADGKQERLHFNYKDVIKGKNMQQNVELQSGDTIVVP